MLLCTPPCRTMQENLWHHAAEFVDFLILCKCSAGSHTIIAKDCASVEINIADLVETTSNMTRSCKDNAVCGSIRQMG
ncbi:hypothetical protein BsWGS_20866 [Bradybaena similaris]